MVACDLCNLETVRDAEVLLENESCIYAANGFTTADVLPGSGIIVPRAHRQSPFELTETEWADTRALLLEARRETDRRLSPDGYNLGWNVGSVAGQLVAHVHLHVVPRFADEPHAGRGIRWWLKQPENRRADPTRRGGGSPP